MRVTELLRAVLCDEDGAHALEALAAAEFQPAVFSVAPGRGERRRAGTPLG